MEFIHRAYVPGETISAIATPPGHGGIAVIRISGKQAFQVAAKIFSKPVEKLESHRASYGTISSLTGEKLDQVLLLPMKGPRSFTGEDVVEIHCHGGSLIAKRVLAATFEAGARPANPGEFSFQAFMNGKIDLAQAEAIQAVIGAQNEYALTAAGQLLDGALSERVRSYQKELVHTAAIFEAWVDFPEEGLEFKPFAEVIAKLNSIISDLKKLVATFHNGKMIDAGVQLCLVGAPNVGKSSLMNALLGRDRAIVSPIAGTTRDVVEDSLRLNNLHFRLLDTAGIRSTSEMIEEEGIRRSKIAANASDLVLLVLDVTNSEIDSLAHFVDELPRDKTVAIWNKIDLEHRRPLPQLPFQHVVEVSAEKRQGLEDLHAAIDQIIWEKGAPKQGELIITNLRHKEALAKTVESLEQVVDGLEKGLSAEFVASDMRQALNDLGTIIGTNITEDILTQVFSSFCIGK